MLSKQNAQLPNYKQLVRETAEFQGREYNVVIKNVNESKLPCAFSFKMCSPFFTCIVARSPNKYAIEMKI